MDYVKSYGDRLGMWEEAKWGGGGHLGSDRK